MTALLFWSFALGPSLLVAAPLDCPAPAAVDARVRDILGLRADAPLDERATIAREGASLRVTVHGNDDRVLGDRLLQADGSCDELAGAVAVVMVAYVSDVHPEYVGSLPAQPAPLPTSPAPHAVDSGPAPSQRGAASTRHFQLGVALGAQLGSAAATPFGALGARWLPARSGFGLAASMAVTGARQVELSNGGLRYFRWPLTFGPVFRAPIAGADLDLHAGAALSWLHLAGVDFTPSTSRDVFALGGFGAARVSVGAGAFVPFAEVSGVWWQHTEAFVQHGPDQPTVSLPALEVYAALGAAWRAW